MDTYYTVIYRKSGSITILSVLFIPWYPLFVWFRLYGIFDCIISNLIFICMNAKWKVQIYYSSPQLLNMLYLLLVNISWHFLYSLQIICAKCASKLSTLNNDIILCDGVCDRGFHQKCLTPPLLNEDSKALFLEMLKYFC